MKKLCLAGVIIVLLLTGCSIKKIEDGRDREDVPFVILGSDMVSDEIKEMIEEKKEEEIKLTYEDQDKRYIIIGYGRQNKGGYSIYIKELYKTDQAIYVDTELIPPSKEEEYETTSSYPVMVIQVKETTLPVVFR